MLLITKKIVKFTAGAVGFVAGFALVSGLVSACGSSGGSGGIAGSGPGSGGGLSGSGSSGSVVVAPGVGARLSGVVSGAELWQWVPNGLYPSDITEIPGTAYNTGGTVKANAQHDLRSLSCADLVGYLGGPGFGEVAFLVDGGENPSQTNAYEYAVYEFANASGAASFVEDSAAAALRCGGQTIAMQDPQGGAMRAQLGLGPTSSAQVAAADTAVDLRDQITDNGKDHLGELLLAADGNIVIAETDVSTTGSLPTEASLPHLAQEVLTALAQREAGGAGAGSSPAAAGSGAWVAGGGAR